MNASIPQKVSFFKMQGCGNDFILIDNRSLGLDPSAMADWALALCRRAFGIGADGLIFLDEAGGRPRVDYIWHFFNADGSRAQMCGNGARCAAKLAVLIGLAGPRHSLGADNAEISAEVDARADLVRVEMPKPGALETGIELDGPSGRLGLSFVNTGVPHAVIFVDNAATALVAELGPFVRYHPRFAPAGTNVNFVTRAGHGKLRVRTYERGVEGETYACGTGACASVLAARAITPETDDWEITTSGGETLFVTVSGQRVFLTGAAQMVFTGVFEPAALGLGVRRAASEPNA